VAKDRARPFSKKHRLYWLTVTGGMLLIGAINVGIGMCAYDKGPDHVDRIEPVLPTSTAPVQTHVIPGEGMLGLGEIPVLVMRAFTKAHPQSVPQGAKKLADGTIEVFYLDEGARRVARYRADGTAND
jgi:hypothetical protein